MKQPDKNKKISLDDLRNEIAMREQSNLVEQAQNQYNEKPTTFNLQGDSDGLQQGQVDYKANLLSQADAGSEMAISQLKDMGYDINIPDADGSHLTSWLFNGPANAAMATSKAVMALASTKRFGALIGAAYKGKNIAAPVVKNIKQAKRLAKSGQPYAMPAAVIPTAAKTAEKVAKAKPVQSAKAAKSYLERATEMAKTGASKLNPRNWSPTMKATTGLGALYGAYETFFGDDEGGVTDMIGFSNENKEVPKSKVTRNAKGELEYKKEMGMGGSIQHEGGVQKSITDRMSEYIGRDHADGGIKLKNAAIEVEGGEAEYADMPMANGGASDYIFSDKINYGSGTFADKAKTMAKEGGSEEQIINLAKMQEAAARNKGEKGRDPDMIMEEGGLKKMVNGGPERKNLGNEGIATQQSGLGGGYFGSADTTMISEEEERKDFFNRNKTILGDLGIHSYQDYNPTKHAEMFQKKVNSHYKEKFENDEALRGELAKQGISDVDAYVKSVGFGGEGAKALDFNHGEHHNSMTTEPKKPVEDKVINQDAGVTKSGSEEEIVNEAPSNTFGNIANTAAIGMALNDKPDYVSTPGLVTPGAVVAGNQARVNLDRVDYSSQLATNSSDNVGMNKAIDQSGGGSSNMANRMAAFAAKKKADRQITSDETNANTQIANQEVGINSSIDARNVANQMDASKTNASNILTASNANVSNAMRAEEFNRGADAATFDRKLNAVETSAANINQIYRDKAQYASNERVAKAQSGKTGVYERELYENLLKKLNQNG
jgi:hypothetical protein|tara:strand:+ start:1855 stop:4182 length:2328 start_codon:yes stop_codon:yes gene_type:complete